MELVLARTREKDACDSGTNQGIYPWVPLALGGN